MDDLLAAIGLVFVIEGLLWALFPGYGVRMIEVMRTIPLRTLRLTGAAAVAIGLAIVWLARG